MVNRKGLVALVLGLTAVAYLWGGYSFRHDIFPMPNLRALKGQIFSDAAQQTVVQPHTPMEVRLAEWPGKARIDCPPQNQRMAVLLLIGQSNAANWSGQRYQSVYGESVVNFFQGRCFVAASPLLGSSGRRGESWTRLGDKLIESKDYESIVLIPIAVGNTAIGSWAVGGDVNAMLADELQLIHRSYEVTHVLWHQGESDYSIATSTEAYRSGFASLLRTIRSGGVEAPVFVSVATRCGPLANWTANNPVATAQRSLPDAAIGVFPGVDTDSLLSEMDRFDDCHFAATGQEKFVDAWIEILKGLR